MTTLSSEFRKVYETVNAFVARTGGDNSNGRISRSFFPDRTVDAPDIKSDPKDVAFWQPARGNGDDVKFTSVSETEFEIDTSVAGDERHTNIEFQIDAIPSGAAFVAVGFDVQVKGVARSWPKLVALVKLTADDTAQRLDKEAVPLTKTPGESSSHRICFAVQPGEKRGIAVLHIPKDCGVHLAFSGANISFLDQNAEPLHAETKAGPTADELDALRKFRLPGTEDIAPVVGQRIDMIAGCETSYISAYLKDLGFQTHHSFEHHRAMDPYTELVAGDSPYLTSDAEHVVLSQVQVLRPLITKMERAAGLADRTEIEEWINATVNALRWSIEQLRAKRNCNVWIFTHPGYHTPAMGVFEYRSGAAGWSVYEMLTHYKMATYALAREFPNVFVIDVDLAMERLGKLPLGEPARIRLFESLGGHLETDGSHIVGEHFIHQLLSLSKKVRKVKCIVVDCDNTLWKGVLREDGADNVKIDRKRFHRLWHLSQRGIPIALCSKNDAADTDQILEIVSRYGALKNAIVTTRINWLPKSENIQSIADELNINPDTVAFFDDSPFEREQVKTALPQVHVFTENEIYTAPEMPIFQLNGDLNEDSASRVSRYKDEQKRTNERDSFGADKFEDFLMQCEMRLETRLAQKSELSRVAEIFQRTNQMNATLKRADLGAAEDLHASADGAVHIVKLGDKFGDYGIIGASMSRVVGNRLHIDELALSCRAMGRRVEDALLEELIGHANDQGLDQIAIDVATTSRNGQIVETLGRVGFAQSGASKPEGQSTWSLSLKDAGRSGRNFARWFSTGISIAEDID